MVFLRSVVLGEGRGKKEGHRVRSVAMAEEDGIVREAEQFVDGRFRAACGAGVHALSKL
jgi:hypothetical protein